MNRKGQVVGVNMFLLIFVGVMAALVLYQGILPFIDTTTRTITTTNRTFTLTNGSVTDLDGQELIGTPIVTNSTAVVNTALLINSDNYTIDEGVSTTTGVKSIQFEWASASTFAGTECNISYTYGPDGYIDSAGGRSMMLLIPIFAALAIMVIALSPTLRSGILNSFK